MPRLNGVQCLAQIKKDKRLSNIPVIIYSTTQRREDIEEAIGGGSRKIVVSGVSARIIGEQIEHVGSDGKLITESYRDFAKNQITSEYRSLDEFIQKWNASDRKRAIIDELEEQGIVRLGLNPEEFAAYVAADRQRWGRVIRDANITVN